MSTRATYDELDTLHDLHRDCRKVGARMRADRIARHAPQLPRRMPRASHPTAGPTLAVGESAARLAGDLYDD